MDLTQPDARQAFFVLEGIANFNTYLKYCVDGIEAAQGFANSFTDQWVNVFSYTAVLDKAITERQLLIGQLQNALSLVLAFAGLAGAIASAAFGFMFGSVSSALGDPPEKFDTAADLGAYIGNLTNASTAAINDLGQRLFTGQTDNSGNHIWQYLANGSYANPSTVKAPQIQQFLQQQYIAAGINALWRSQRTYIIAAPTQSGISCADDARGPADGKLCLDELKDKVFYAYMIPPTPSSKHQYPQVFLPHGYTNMSAYPSLDLQSAMTASVRAYYIAKFDYESVRQQRWFDAMRNSTVLGSPSPASQGYSFEGMFTLPVCSDFYGNFISAVKSILPQSLYA